MNWVQPIEPFVFWLLQTSWQASLLAIFVLLLQWIFRRRLDARWIYLLWGLVLIRLLAPNLPESPSSVYHFTSVPISPSAWMEPLPGTPVEIQLEKIEPATPELSLPTLLSLIWLAGASLVALASLFLHFRLAQKLARAQALNDPALKTLLADCARELGCTRPPSAVLFPSISSPAVVGLWRPRLLLPENLAERFSRRELRFIFLHELAHLKRGDLVVQWLLTLLQIFHWFNPVLWFAFSRIRKDREAATDATVLAQAGESSRSEYGHTLLKLLEQFEHRNSLAGIVGILENKGPIQQRIFHISRFTRSAYRCSFLAVFLLLGAAAVFLTDSQPSQNLRAQVPDSDQPRSIQIETKIMEIPISTLSPSELTAYRNSLKNYDFVSLAEIKGADLLTAPSIVITSGNNGIIEVTRDFRLPTSYEKSKGQPMSPVKFETYPIGVQVYVSPKTLDDGIMLSGKLVLRNFEGLTQEETNKGASFSTRETVFNVLLQDNVPRLVGRSSRTAKQTIQENNRSRDELIESEILLILSARKPSPQSASP